LKSSMAGSFDEKIPDTQNGQSGLDQSHQFLIEN